MTKIRVKLLCSGVVCLFVHFMLRIKNHWALLKEELTEAHIEDFFNEKLYFNPYTF